MFDNARSYMPGSAFPRGPRTSRWRFRYRPTAVPLQRELGEGVQAMRALRRTLVALVVVIIAVGSVSVALAATRSVGQVIDDTVITTEVKAKLSAEKLSNLTKIEVKTDQGIVTLNGTVDDPARAARAVQI